MSIYSNVHIYIYINIYICIYICLCKILIHLQFYKIYIYIYFSELSISQTLPWSHVKPCNIYLYIHYYSVRACVRACMLTSYDTPLILPDAWFTGPSGVLWFQITTNMTRVVNVTSVRLHTETQ